MRGALLFVSLAACLLASCVFPDTTTGDDCKSSGDCDDDKVCLPIDVEKPGADLVCLPMHSVDAPVSCAADDDCIPAGFPVDASCDPESNTCTCNGDPATFHCGAGIGDSAEVRVIDPQTCKCVAASTLVDGQ